MDITQLILVEHAQRGAFFSQIDEIASHDTEAWFAAAGDRDPGQWVDEHKPTKLSAKGDAKPRESKK